MTRITRLLTMFVFVFALLVSMGSFVNTAKAWTIGEGFGKPFATDVNIEDVSYSRSNSGLELTIRFNATYTEATVSNFDVYFPVEKKVSPVNPNFADKCQYDSVHFGILAIGQYGWDDGELYCAYSKNGILGNDLTVTSNDLNKKTPYEIKVSIPPEMAKEQIEFIIADRGNDIDKDTGTRGITSFLKEYTKSYYADIKAANMLLVNRTRSDDLKSVDITANITTLVSNQTFTFGVEYFPLGPNGQGLESQKKEVYFRDTSGKSIINRLTKNKGTKLDATIKIEGLDPAVKYGAYLVNYGSVDGSAYGIIPTGIPDTPVKSQKFFIDLDNASDPLGGAPQEGVNDDTNAGDENNVECPGLLHPIQCLATIYYNYGTSISASILIIVGKMFDAFLAISISSDIYDTTKANFVYLGWKIVRDLANIFFIFILLYTSIGTILGIHGIDYKKVVVKVIVIGLLINFSLMFTRVVIDAGNILSRVFYNQITVNVGGQAKGLDKTNSKTSTKEKQISSAILNGIGLQAIPLNEKIQNGKISYGTVFLIGTIIIIFNLAIAWVLFMSAAFFVGRIGALWFAIIFAPLAFVSHILPSLDHGLKQLGWSNWLKGLMDAAFKAPIFMFMIYIIVTLTGSGFIKSLLNGATKETTSIESIIVVLIPLMIILGLLMKAKDMAKDMAGEFGGVMDGLVKAGVGVGAMALTGGVAAIGAKTFGARAMNTLNDQHLRDLAGNNISEKYAREKMNFTGKSKDFEQWKIDNKKTIDSHKETKGFKEESAQAQDKLLRAKRLSERSFDIRNTGIGNQLGKATGVNMDMGSGIASMAGLNMSSGDRAGGAKGESERRITKDEKRKKDIEEALKGDPIKKHKLEEQKTERENEVKDLEEELNDINSRIESITEEERKGSRKKEYEDLVRDRLYIKNDIKTQKNGGVNTKTGAKIEKADSLNGIQKQLDFEEKGRVKGYYKTLHDRAHDRQHAYEYYNKGKGSLWNYISMDDIHGRGGVYRRQLIDSIKNLDIFSVPGDLTRTVTGSFDQATSTLSRLVGVLEDKTTHTNLSGASATQAIREDLLASDSHYHSKQFKTEYKAVNSGFFEIFNSIGKGGGDHGGGHGHDDHGDSHGHDDHGGGHH